MPQVVPTVSIVDDDISVRESLEALIRHEGWQPQLFESANAFLSSPPVPGPGCLILDVNLPDLNGLDIQERIAADRAGVPIIFLTGYGDVPMTVRAMKAGAVEFLTKPFSDEALLEAIRQAIDRSKERLERSARTRMLQECLQTLSSREREVLELVVKGLLNKQVGAELGISEITVKTHRGKVMQKMRARSLADLVGIAAELGIATGPNG
jgi:RNA polymerase sigma factor (sigma-70 family)